MGTMLDVQRPRNPVTIALSVLLLAATGCGAHIAGSSAASGNPAEIAGEWLFTGASDVPVLAAGLTEKAGSVAGTATVYGCGTAAEQTVLHGAVNPKGELILQTGMLAEGSFLRLAGRLSPDGKSLVGPTLAVSGEGCRLPAAQKVTAEVYAPAQGSYTGVFRSSDGIVTPVAAVLSQSAVPGPGGSYALAGSVAFPSSPCLATAAINSAESMVTGGALSATYSTTVSGQHVTITATGTADPSASNIVITGWTIRGGSCDGYSGTGQLTAG